MLHGVDGHTFYKTVCTTENVKQSYILYDREI